MLNSFNSLLIDKVRCVSSENILQEFFFQPCSWMNFFWHDGLVQEFFSYAYALAGYFFSKSPNPPQKLNGRPLSWAIYLKRLNYILIGSHANKDSPVIIMLCTHRYDVMSHFLLDFIKEILATGTNIFWYKQATLNSFKFTVVLTTGDLWDTIVCGIFIFVFI